MSGIVVPDDPTRLTWKMTIGELVDEVTARDPEKIYLYFGDYEITYQEFREQSLRTASLLRDLGVRHGDRVCLFLPNGREVLCLWMGLARLGAICVPINTAYRQAEMAYVLNNAEAKVLVAHHSLMGVAQEAARQCPFLQETVVVSLEGEASTDWRDFWPLLEQASPLTDQLVMVEPQDVSTLLYTSGTTGNPKGVMITHDMYVAAGQGFATWTESTSDDRFFTCLPFFHANTHYYSTMGSLAAGASLAVVDRFSASRFRDQIRESGATVVNFIGMILPVLLKQPPGDTDRDNTVRIFYGSPALAPELLREFEERFGVEVLIGFALTECCYGTIEPMGQAHRRGSAGLPRRHPDPRFRNSLRLVADSGEPVEPGKVGEITLRSPAVMPGYWRDPERTEEAIRGGWLHTGDLGWQDEDGYLYFVDRKKDVIRRRGENVSSQEVEDVIKRHPGVLDCAVIAVPSDVGEDDVKAYVVPRPFTSLDEKGPKQPGDGEMAQLRPEDVVYWCADRLAYFKVPRYVELRDDLPRTPSLRVRKELLRQEREDLISGSFDREKAGIRIR